MPNEYTMHQLASRYQLSSQQLRLYIAELGIRPAKQIGPTHLYDDAAIALLDTRIASPKKRGAKKRISADQIANMIRSSKAAKGIHLGNYSTLCHEVYELIESHGITNDGTRFSNGKLRDLYLYPKVQQIGALFGVEL